MFPDLTIDELGKQTHSKASKIIKTKKTKVFCEFILERSFFATYGPQLPLSP